MKHFALATSAFAMAVLPTTVLAAPQTLPAKNANVTKQSYCERVIIITEDSIEDTTTCYFFSDGSV